MTYADDRGFAGMVYQFVLATSQSADSILSDQLVPRAGFLLAFFLAFFARLGVVFAAPARWGFTLPAVAFALGAACFDFVRVAARFVFGSTFDVSPTPAR